MPFGMFVPPENPAKWYLLFLAQNLFSNPSNLVKESNKKYPDLAENDPDDGESNTIQTIMDWVLHWIVFLLRKHFHQDTINMNNLWSVFQVIRKNSDVCCQLGVNLVIGIIFQRESCMFSWSHPLMRSCAHALMILWSHALMHLKDQWFCHYLHQFVNVQWGSWEI